MPKVQEQGQAKGAGRHRKKLAGLDDFYKNGDLDVRSIISMVSLNGIESDEDRGNLLEHMVRKYYRRAVPSQKAEAGKRKNAAEQ